MTTPNKEQVYDDQISPLMAQILAICQEHKIAMLASFYIPTEADPDLCCTSMTPDETGDNPPHLKAAFRALKGVPVTSLAFTVTSSAEGG